VPDYWVLVNEPDLVRVWTPAQLGERMVLLGRRMRRAGLATRISAPETVQPGGVSAWLSAIAATPEARGYLGGISYHSYDYDPTIGQRPPAAPRASVANWSRLLNLPVAQTEQGQAGKENAATRWNGLACEFTLDIAENIFADLLHANASAWQMHAIIGWGQLGNARAAGTFAIARKDGSGYDKPAQYWGARHFTRWLRPGAVRVGLHSSLPRSSVLAAAFLAPSGRPVIVAMNRGTQEHELRITGLPAGGYTVSLTTREVRAAERALVPLTAGQSLRFSLPAESVATLFVP
jgi:O-glycosyl hydrolase